MQSLWQDLRYGVRGIRANLGFSSLAILTLALGIGAGTTMFSVIKNVLLSPFPYKNPEQIAAFNIHDLDRARPGGRTDMKAAEYLEFRQQNHVFSGDTGGGNEDVLWTTGVGTEQLDGAYVTPDTFQFLGVSAQVGRGLTPEDGKPGAPPVFVMSYKMWQRRFNLDPSILGRSFTLNGTPTTLVGIMPKRFTKRGADIWRPAGTRPRRHRSLVHLPGTAEAWRHAETGGGRPAADRAALGQGPSEGLSEALFHPGQQLRGQYRGAVPQDAVHAGRGGGAAVVDCLRERGEHAAGAVHRARSGDGDPRRAGRQPVARGAATAGGESDARAGRSGARLRLRVCGNQSAGDGDPGRRDSQGGGDRVGPAGIGLQPAASPSSPRCSSGLRRRCNWRAAILSSR